MIDSHPTITERISEDERRILPLLVSLLQAHVGKRTAITSFALAAALNKYVEANRDKFRPKFKVAGSRLRKMINHIRIRRLLPGLCGLESGYFLADSRDDLKTAIVSLRQRADAIRAVSEALEADLQNMENPLKLRPRSKYKQATLFETQTVIK